MKRLTYRVNIGVPEDVILVDHKSVEECQEWKNVLERLSYYEDLEEQGLLPKLPCKIGTKVYYVQKCLAPSCKECLGFTQVNNCYCQFKSRIFEQEFDFRHLKAFGETVFLTQAEAEEALKRMGEENER